MTEGRNKGRLGDWTNRLLAGTFVALLLFGCGSGGSSNSDDIVEADLLTDAVMEPDGRIGEDRLSEDGSGEVAPEVVVGPPPRTSQSFKTHPTIEQVYIWSAEPELAMELVDADGAVIASGSTDYQGSLVLRELPAGKGYSVRPVEAPEDYTGPLEILSVEESWPEDSFYESQVIEPGYGYLTMRDGILLSMFVSLPGPVEDGPYPTVVNYSGYSPSRPGQSLGGIVEGLCPVYPILCDAPDAPSALITGLLGYASVSVNVRGTGCSGGAYDYFETLQLLDGYDVIELVARQSWVKHHKVGMVGLSYPGNSQLFVAATNPPSLAAITPMSVIADTATSTLVPGGILNDGFALEWIEHVLNKSEPYAHQWITDLVEAGDTVCEEHQLLHSQKVDVIAKAYANPFYTDDVAGPLDPTKFVQVIDVPVFLTGQLQDEQTGPHFPILFPLFTGAPLTRFTLTNGVHADGFSPQVLAEWFNFLSFYVAREIPSTPGEVAAMVPMFMEQVYGDMLEMPPGRFDGYTDFDTALADYEAELPIRVIFESGAHPDVAPQAPQGTFDQFYDAWPIPGTEAIRWYCHADGTLAPELPAADGGGAAWQPDPDAGDRVTLASGSVDTIPVDWTWPHIPAGKGAAFVTEPLTDDLVLIGSGSVDLWLQSTATDADLEVAVTEVRPDGMESYVQVGWLRASHRNLLPESTELRPVSSHYEEDVEPLTPGEWSLARVELMPVSHIFRAGSQVRLTIDTPGDSMARWRFKLLEYDELPTHTIGHHEAHPSSIVLPVVPGIDVPTELPPCDVLRGQPCREYVPFQNAVVE